MGETLIQSQLVKITGTEQQIKAALMLLEMHENCYGCTVTVMPSSVPEAQGSVTEGVTKFSRSEDGQ